MMDEDLPEGSPGDDDTSSPQEYAGSPQDLNDGEGSPQSTGTQDINSDIEVDV